jgi:hypothetical protein
MFTVKFADPSGVWEVCGFVVVRLPGLRVRILPESWVSVCCEFSVWC